MIHVGGNQMSLRAHRRDAGSICTQVDGACDAFVEVLVQPKKVDGQIQYTKLEAGRRACDVWKDAGSS